MKAELWKSTQRKRDGWERKYQPIIKKTLNRQFKEVADRIDVTNYLNENLPDTIITSNPIKILLINLYGEVGSYFAKESYRQLKLQNPRKAKDDDLEDYWYEEMTNYARTDAGNKITSITVASREAAKVIIRNILQMSTDNGWGAEETAREIRKALVQQGVEMNQWRALRIARTEVMTSSNIGAMKGAKSTDLPMEKFWIATYDNRTRDTHMVMEQQNPIDIDESFDVGEYKMLQPGDDSLGAGPEEIINCRCTIAFNVKQL